MSKPFRRAATQFPLTVPGRCPGPHPLQQPARRRYFSAEEHWEKAARNSMRLADREAARKHDGQH